MIVSKQIEKVAWHAMEKDEVLHKLKVDSKGLTKEEAQIRLIQYGYNEFKKVKRRTTLQIFLNQLKDVFIILLIIATLFSVVVGYYESKLDSSIGLLETYTDAITISLIVILCVIAGFVQEFKAEKAIEALKKLTTLKARVIRNGKETIIPAREIVPGDILVLETGDRIPADARILEVVELKTNEAVLTGESTPVKKRTDVISKDTPVSERNNMVFSGTHVVYGRGKAVVITTGMNTEFGKIAGMVQTTKEERTPLQKRLDSFASKLAKIVIAICIVIFALEFFEGIIHGWKVEGFIQALMTSIALAVSAVPEGLPAVVIITLALGAKEFTKRNSIIRRLSSAETLGSVTVICADKTGTLTKGEMTVKRIYVNGETIEVTGTGYMVKGKFLDGKESKEELLLLLKSGALCNNAKLENGKIIGDPTEGALIVSAAKAGISQEELKNYPRIGEIPFSSERRCMTTIHTTPEGKKIAFTKGATETILAKCDKILRNGKEDVLTEAIKRAIIKINEDFAGDALRVLAMAYKWLPENLNEFDETVENGMVFIGLQGMIDPPREDAIEAIKTCQKAGIRTIMITGDHKLTAVAIAKQIGILKSDDIVLTGTELDDLDEEKFKEIVEKVSVYARVTAEHKLRIVRALQTKNHIVAMTGDGVNDAPAVKKADVGVAMGITGTDVTKEASDLVLLDDNFTTIVRAVELGRGIYDNIRKFIRFLISCNFNELFVIGLFAILGGIFGERVFPLPLLPAMILWINLVTDGIVAVPLALDPPEKGIMERKPHKPDEGILHGMFAFILAAFILQALGTLLVFSIEYYVWMPAGFGTEETLMRARTAAFIQATLFEVFVVWNCRSETRSVWKMGKDNFKNKYFVIANIAGFALTLMLCYIPITQQMFHVVPLTLTELVCVIGISSLGLLVLPEILIGRKLWKWQ